MTLHPQARALIEQLPPSGPPDLSTVDADRAAARSAALAQADRVPIEHVVDLDADGVPVRLYRPRRGAPVALYVHGGGWMFHDVETHDAFCRYLADATGWALLAVDYRRAPEHPYPARSTTCRRPPGGSGRTVPSTTSTRPGCRASVTRRAPTCSPG